CEIAGWKGPLHRCSFYGNREVGAKLDAMLASGLEREVDGLLAAGYGRDSPGMKAIGYAEFLDAPIGPDGRRDVRAVAEAIKLHTRRYAKRQLTFMRAIPGVRWFGADDYDGIADAATEWLRSP
ncbi:MAG TPA: M2 family metallopeptidase, partial [Spirochaetales bacterium]|nr:M2 family metallopeptidase [Spirochaetales bacterium]